MKPIGSKPFGLLPFMRVRAGGETSLRGNTPRPALLERRESFRWGGISGAFDFSIPVVLHPFFYSAIHLSVTFTDSVNFRRAWL